MAGKGNPNWSKGKSGNPSGRPKELGYLKELAQKHTVDAINTLVDVMHNGESGKERAFAADKILDRAYGKPSQSIEAKAEVDAVLNIIFGAKTDK